MNNKKSIKSKLILIISSAFIVIFAAAFISTYSITRSTLRKVKHDTMEKIVADASRTVNSQINEKFTLAKSIASDNRIASSSVSRDEKVEVLKHYCDTLGLRSMGLIDSNADFITTDAFTNNISEKPYFKSIMNGKTYISNPQIDKKTGSQISFVAIPIHENGKVIGGVTCTFDSGFLSEDIKDLQYFGIGEAIILDPEGTIVGDRDIEVVKEGTNVFKTDNLSKDLEAIYTKAINSESGLETVDNNYYIYTSIEDVEGWSIVMKISVKEANKDIVSMVSSYIVIGIFGTIIFLVALYKFGDTLGKRLNILKESIDVMAKGIFNEEMNPKELRREDEIGHISNALKNTKESISFMISEVKNDVNIINEQSEMLKTTSTEINEGAENISHAMHEAAEGNTNQSGQLLSVNKEMELFSDNIDFMNDHIENVAKISSNIQVRLNEGNDSISQLNESVENFNGSFGIFNKGIIGMNEKISSIENITSTISSISEQTNLLALNAAIEAARAGEAGKGFSVVAEEIRKLADQSQQSVDEIGSIIANVLKECKNIIESTDAINGEVSNQKEKIEMTIKAFTNIEELLSDVTPKIEEISSLSENNNERKDVVVESIQSVTAISEELAASTEEVDATAEEFKGSSEAISKASNELIEIIEKLNHSINEFKI